MSVKLRNHLGDVLRALRGVGAQTDSQRATIVRLLGFQWVETSHAELSTPIASPLRAITTRPTTKVDVPTDSGVIYSDRWLNLVSTARVDIPDWYSQASTLPYTDDTDDQPKWDISPLRPTRWLRTTLRDALLKETYSHSIDLERLIELIANRRPMHHIPRQRLPALQHGAQILVDIHSSLRPYHEDQARVVTEVRRLLNQNQLEIVYVDGYPEWAVDADSDRRIPLPRPQRGWSILILSNLGFGPADAPAWKQQAAWLQFTALRQHQGHPVVTMYPGSLNRLPVKVRRRTRLLSWDRSVSEFVTEEDALTESEIATLQNRRLRRVWQAMPDVVRLAKHLSLSGRVPRVLLRHVRLQFCPTSDAGLEADLWFSPLVQTRTHDSILFFPDITLNLQQLLLASGELEATWHFLTRFQKFRPQLARLQEELAWLSLKQDEASRMQLDASVASVIKSLVEQDRNGLGHWALAAVSRLPIDKRSDRTKLLEAVARERLYGSAAVPTSGGERTVQETARAIVASHQGLVPIGLLTQGTRLRFSDPPEPGAEILKVPAGPTRSVYVDDREISWQADEPCPEVHIPNRTSLEIRTADQSTYEIPPVAALTATAQRNLAGVMLNVVAESGRPVAPAFFFTPDTVIASKRRLEAAGYAPGSQVQLSFLSEPVEATWTASRDAASQADTQIQDELITLTVSKTSHSVPNMEFSELAEGTLVYAVSCDHQGKTSWTRFDVVKQEGLGLHLRAVAMLRWLELQNWSGSLLLQSTTWQPVGFAVAGAGGLLIRRPPPIQKDTQSRLDRVRRPSTHITFDRQTNGVVQVVELPFVVGVIADFGESQDKSRPVSHQRFREIDRYNFDDIMQAIRPELFLRVPCKLNANDDDVQMHIILQFAGLQDFHPAHVARQVPELNSLLRLRATSIEWLSLFDRSTLFERMLLKSLQAETEQEGAVVTPPGSSGTNEDFARARSRSHLNSHRLLTQLATRIPQVEAERLVAGLEMPFFEKLLAPAMADPYEVFKRCVAELDALVSVQLAEIMHHEQFQALEAAWRGLADLVFQTETGPHLKIRMMPISRRELRRDFEEALEFDQSEFYRQLSQELYVPEGQPYAALVADFAFDHSPEDLLILQNLALIGSACHCPIIAAASPKLFQVESFTELPNPRDLNMVFHSWGYARWNALRSSIESRYVVLTLPRVLARLPYGHATQPIEEFGFEEILPNSHDPRQFCWINAAYVYARTLTRAFNFDGLATSIRGVESGGRVEGLPTYVFQNEDGGHDQMCPTEVAIDDRREADMAQLGLLPLCHYKHSDFAVFFGANTLHRPAQYDSSEATNNATIAARVPFIMVETRFTHYIHRMISDSTGRFFEAKDLEAMLRRWIANYVYIGLDLSETIKARFPLREAAVYVEADSTQKGHFQVEIYLLPFLKFEELTSAVKIAFSIRTPSEVL